MSHPDDSTIERFVMGGLDDEESFIAHVSACEECSRKLQREAELEVSLIDVRQRAAELDVLEARVRFEAQPIAEATVHPLRARLARSAPVFAAAAAVLLLAGVGARRFVASRTSDTTAGAATAVVSCPDGDDQIGCIARAHRAGNLVEYPKGPLAALGSEPGLSLYLEPRFSDGVVVEVDDFIVKAKADLAACAETVIVSEKSPVQTGEVGINFTIAPGGNVEQSQTSLVLHNVPPKFDIDAPMGGTDMALGRCLSKTVHAFPFKGASRPVRLSFIAKYVWRE
jgi:hypothetical protein